MLKAIREFSANMRNSTSGNAAMLVAIGMPMLIGGAGLAVDTAQWYMWKRELQHSVDQAAIGAAWSLSQVETKEIYKSRAKEEYEANLSVTKGFAGDPVIQLANFAGGEDNSVIVSAKATKSLPFSNFLMKGSATIAVRAQASWKDGGEYNACLVALAEESGVLDIGGSATVKAKCGLAALSCEDDAITISGSATVDTDSIATCGTASVPSDNEDVLSEHVQGLEDIYRDLVPPKNDTNREYECETFGKGKNKYTAATLQPGTYSEINVKCETVLQSGIYVINGGVLDLAANYNVIGTNVMFVLKNGAYLKWGGSGNGNKINLTPMQESDFLGTAYNDMADKYAGILVFEDRNNRDKKGDRVTHTLNGNSNSIIEGLMYMPSGTVKINGTADIAAQCLQISAWKIKVTGNANLETLCPTDETMSVGSSLSEVRLVA